MNVHPAATAPSFIFCLTQVGSEKWLKKEVAQSAPALKFAFSRPGFLTFKSENLIKHPPQFTFSRVTALSHGKFKSDQIEALKAKVEELRAKHASDRLRVHLTARDCIGSEDDPKTDPSAAWVQSWRERVSDFLPDVINEPALHHDPILHLIVVEENEIWLGLSIKRAWYWGLPGGRLKRELPELAPSRAYMKIEEAIVLSGVRLEKTDRAIEIGSAPGGACYALLERGLTVTGIDRGEMAKAVVENPRFKWKACSIRDYSIVYEDPKAEWVLVDMNTEPRVSVKESMPLLEHVAPELCGILLTMKENYEAVLADLPVLTESLVRKLKLKKVQLTQLPSNRSEVCFMGLTELGLKRLPT